MCRVERWTVRTLRDKISGMLIERTALSKKPAALARQELATLRDEDCLTTELPSREVLRQKLREAVQLARAKLAAADGPAI